MALCLRLLLRHEQRRLWRFSPAIAQRRKNGAGLTQRTKGKAGKAVRHVIGVEDIVDVDAQIEAVPIVPQIAEVVSQQGISEGITGHPDQIGCLLYTSDAADE